MKQILTFLQSTFLKHFFATYLGEKFFLTGGTALSAFYLRHRLSEDLDFFTLDQNLSLDEVNAETRKIAFSLDMETDHRISTSTFSRFFLKTKKTDVLKIDFVKDVPLQFGKIKKIGSVRIDSLQNISVNKLLAIYGRFDAKDYVDFYLLLKKSLVDFNDIFKNAQKKDKGLNKFYFANMIADVEKLEHFPSVLISFSTKKMTEFYLTLSQKIFKEIKPKL